MIKLPRPKIYFSKGFWRVTHVPVKWHRLTLKQMKWWSQAHEFVQYLNSKVPWYAPNKKKDLITNEQSSRMGRSNTKTT